MIEEQRPLVLTVDDDPDLTAIIAHHVRRWGYASAAVHSASELWKFLARRRPQMLLLDVFLGDADGSRLVSEVRRAQPQVPVVMITRSTSLEAAVRCMKHGAADYITKPIDFDRLEEAVRQALDVGRLAPDVAAPDVGATDEASPDSVRGKSARDAGSHGLIGSSPAMRRLFQQIDRLAQAEVPALLLGETGTGKELVARALHRASRRGASPFVAVNAAAIPHELIESLLFGHEKGAFTGAAQARAGYCEQANGGTLFLDEIAEMHFEVQAKLLRFLQDHKVQRIGATASRRVDVRVLAATHADPARQIAERKLREDLYYRLRVVSLRLPPLRERDGDIVLLAEHFLRRAALRHGRQLMRLAPAAIARLESYAWPGNVRELENMMEEVVVLHEGGELRPEMLPAEMRSIPVSPTSAPRNPREIEERRAVQQALAQAAGRPEKAAEMLGMSRATIYRKIKKYGLADR